MDINTFRNKTKVVVTDELIKSVIDGYVNSNVPFYNEKNSLMSCMEMDSNNGGLVDINDNFNFISSIMLNNLFDCFGGKEEYLKLSDEEKSHLGKEEYDSIKDKMQKKFYYIYSAKGILEKDDTKNLEHEFVIKMKPENFIFVLKTIYNSLRDNNLENVRIVTPATKYIGAGYNAPIRIKCSTEDLLKVVDMLDGLTNTLESKTSKVMPILEVPGLWYGYEQVSENGQTSSSRFTAAVYEAIKEATESFANDLELWMEDGTIMMDYLRNAKNKYKAMRDIIKRSHYYGDNLITSIIETTKAKLDKFNINMADALRINEVEAKIDNVYGVNNTAQMLFDQRVSEQDVISTPVTISYEAKEKSDEEKRLDSYLEAINNPESENLNTDAEANAQTINTEEQVNAYTEDLASLDASADLNMEVKDATYADESLDSFEQKIDEAIASVQQTVAKTKVLTTGHSIIDEDALNESMTKEFVNSEGVLIPDLKDIAYGGDILTEALATGGYYTDNEYLQSLAKHFKINDYTGSSIQNAQILYNLRHLELFNQDGSRIGSDDLTAEEKASLTTEKTVDTSILDNSLAGDYFNAENVLIPDLTHVAYAGNNLKEALKKGGYPCDLDYLRNLAKHFNINDYNGEIDQDMLILNYLRHKETETIEEGKEKYRPFFKDLDVLDRKVKDQDYTLYEFYEKYDLLSYIKPDSKIIMHESSSEISGMNFVKFYLNVYLLNNGKGDLKTILDYFIEEIKDVEPPKRA